MDSQLVLILGAILALVVLDAVSLFLAADSRDNSERRNWW